MIVGTAGHIDHGKTSLVRALTGVNTDRLKEEQERGITLDLGYAYVPLANGDVLGYVDVPGHEKLIHNMLAGATGIDFVLLVIAADDGPMPQTREHLEILDLLGLNRGAVALAKVDLVDETRRTEAVAQIATLLDGTSLEGCPLFPVSATSGEGVDELREHLEQHALGWVPRPRGGRFRLAVDRCFTLSGAGTVVTGTVHGGEVRVGDRLTLSPSGIEVRVRGLHVQNRAAELGGTGQRCALNLTGPGFEKQSVSRGDWVVEPDLHRPVQRFAGRLHLLAREDSPLRHWAPVHVHLGAADVTGRVSLLEGDSLAPGESAWAELVLDRPVGALRGDRFVIRDQSARRTLGGGIALDVLVPARGKRTLGYFERLASLEESAPGMALARLLAQQPVNLEDFALQWNLGDADAEALFRTAPLVSLQTAAGRIGFQRDRWAAIRQAILGALAVHHQEHPDEAGLGREALRKAADSGLARPVWMAVLGALLMGGEVVRSGFLLRLPGHRAVLSATERVQWEKIQPALLESPFQPPRVRDIARNCSLDEGQVRTVLRKAEKLGENYQVAHDHFFAPSAVEALAAIAAELGSTRGEACAAEFRDRIGTGRKLAIQILEFFDRIGYTRRAGEGHRVRSDGLHMFGGNG